MIEYFKLMRFISIASSPLLAHITFSEMESQITIFFVVLGATWWNYLIIKKGGWNQL